MRPLEFAMISASTTAMRKKAGSDSPILLPNRRGAGTSRWLIPRDECCWTQDWVSQTGPRAAQLAESNHLVVVLDAEQREAVGQRGAAGVASGTPLEQAGEP